MHTKYTYTPSTPTAMHTWVNSRTSNSSALRLRGLAKLQLRLCTWQLDCCWRGGDLMGWRHRRQRSGSCGENDCKHRQNATRLLAPYISISIILECSLYVCVCICLSADISLNCAKNDSTDYPEILWVWWVWRCHECIKFWLRTN